MARDTQDLQDVLGVRTLDIVSDIDDTSLRERVDESLRVSIAALAVVDALDLGRHEMADVFESANLATWDALAPEVRDLLKAVREACDHLVALFPIREDREGVVDFGPVVDLFGSGFADERASRGQRIDALVQHASSREAEAIGDAVSGLTDIMQRSFVEFGAKLRNPRIVADRWFLLGELHDFKRNCTECLEAIMAAVLQAFSEEPIEDLLPRYANASKRAVTVRTAIVDLANDIDFYNEAFQGPDPDVAQLLDVIEDRLNAFAASPAYAILEPADKKAMILFRINVVRTHLGVQPVEVLRGQIEDFSKYLVMMRDMNRRAELVLFDRNQLEAARTILESGVSDAKTAMGCLFAVYGRSDTLDACIRLARTGQPLPSSDRLRALIDDALLRLDGRGA